MLYVINERRDESPEETRCWKDRAAMQVSRGDRRGEQHAIFLEETTFSVVGASAPFAEKTASLPWLPIVCNLTTCLAMRSRRMSSVHSLSITCACRGIVSDTLSGPSKKRFQRNAFRGR